MIADGGYYSIDGVEHLYLNGITPVIPPSRYAVWHDKEAQFSRIKHCIGSSLLTKRDSSKKQKKLLLEILLIFGIHLAGVNL